MNIIKKIIGPRSKYDRSLPYTYMARVPVIEGDDELFSHYFADTICGLVEYLDKNDIKPDELLIQNGQIKVIDFGWAYDLNRKNPEGWPKELGTTFRCETGYDDRCSFDKVVEFVKRRE